MRFVYLAVMFTCLGMIEPTAAQDCNFSKQIGTCTATISVDRTGGSKPSFSAEITIRSSAAACSKVEWYLDNTPHQTVLKSSNSDTDSVSGTNPISKANFKVQACRTYEGGAGSAAEGGSKKPSCLDRSQMLTRSIASNERSIANYDRAKKNLADERTRSNPNQAYIQQLQQWLTQYADLDRKSRAQLSEQRTCLANPQCSCR